MLGTDHRKSVELLVEAGGARVNRRDGNGLCPLHLAILLNLEKMVKLLLEKGARVDKYVVFVVIVFLFSYVCLLCCLECY